MGRDGARLVLRREDCNGSSNNRLRFFEALSSVFALFLSSLLSSFKLDSLIYQFFIAPPLLL
jgi:hypothetical protein